MIWCDLDNTLVWTWEPLITTPLMSAAFGLPLETHPPRGKGLRRLKRVRIPDLGECYACDRRNVQSFLSELRALAPVCLLTSAVRAYALEMNTAFALGFSAADVFARDDLNGYLEQRDPRAVLIDNASGYGGDDAHIRSRGRKLSYLGIPPGAVVQVPYFCGAVYDPFEHDWRTYVVQTKALLQR